MFRNNNWCAILIYTGEELFISVLLLFLSLYITQVSRIILLSYDFTIIFIYTRYLALPYSVDIVPARFFSLS